MLALEWGDVDLAKRQLCVRQSDWDGQAGMPKSGRLPGSETGGEAGIRTLGRAFRPYNGLANRRLQPLGHLTAHWQVYVTKTLRRKTLRRETMRASPDQTVAS